MRTVLANGLTVLSESVPGVRSVAFGAWVRSGSMHEAPEEMGIAHLLEHMVFKGTARHTARELALALEVLGGSLDAYTTREHTSYQARVLDEHLVQACDVIGELVFAPQLREADLALERKVILEEIAMVDDTPDDVVFDLHAAAMFPGHPYGFSILGTKETVSSITAAQLRARHERAYRPGQVVVAAVGSVTHEALLEALERTGWAAQPAGTLPPPVAPVPVMPVLGQSHVRRRDATQVHIVLGGHAPRHDAPDRQALAVASTLLGGGMSSRLFQRVREDLGLAYAVYAFSNTQADTGQHGVYLATNPEQGEAALRVVREEMAAVAGGAMDEAEIMTGINQLKGQTVLSLDGLSARLYRAAGVALYDEPYKSLSELLAELDAITPAQVRAACAEYLDPARTYTLSLGPTRA
ncbi:MAG: insulinase family protein [Gemmatimonadaceae bacterium]|nr:insulinase family protein [Gemmatimonadaceae bacterium]